MADYLTGILNRILRVEGIQQAFSLFLVQSTQSEEEELAQWQRELTEYFEMVQTEQLDAPLRQYLAATASSSPSQMDTLLELLEYCIRKGSVQARKACEVMIVYEQLTYNNAHFWNSIFKLIISIIEMVDYKGVREVMKGCCEKAKTLPMRLTAGIQPQAKILLKLSEKIMDKDKCLLPGYLLVNELQKVYSECPHWTLSALFSDYIESFRPCAQMLSIIGHSYMRPLVEHSGFPEHLVSPWKLDPITLKYPVKGTLPYEPEVLQPQTGLLRYVLNQPYSKDMVCGMLGLNKQQKQHCQAIEEQLVEMINMAMERSESDAEETEALWTHLSTQLICFVLFHMASFPNIVMTLRTRLEGKDLRKGRDELMWILLQFISGSIQRSPLSNFLPVLKLYELLFPVREMPSSVPDFNQPQCTKQMAMTCIWIHLQKKAQVEQSSLNWPLPPRLKSYHEFLQHLVPPSSTTLGMGNDYRIALLCNAYSTNSEVYNKPMATLVEMIQGHKAGTPPTLPLPTCPLSMTFLDSLTVHSKMSVIHSIVTHIIKMAGSKTGVPLAPALVETYSRLLVYTEIESLGIKGFISQLLPQVYKYHAWGTLYTLLEMFSYRIHHIHPHYRVQLLSHLHSLAAVAQANQTQLHLCVESTALRLILGLGSGDVQPELSRFLQDPKSIVSAESEELNRAIVLTLARAASVTGTDGSWCCDLLAMINQLTPHSWATHTLELFPKAIRDFFTQHPVPLDSRQQLKKAVEEENRKWVSMTNETDIMSHFGIPGSPPLFLCLLWKMLLETNHISPIAYKILERIGARALSAHLRKLCDSLVHEFTSSQGGQQVNKCVDIINDMIWKYNIVTIDRLVLSLVLRVHQGNEAQVCSFIIQLILLKPVEFRNRVSDFVKENSADHWNQTNWHEKHMEWTRKYPEKFAPEEQSTGYHPYFGNVLLRFLPVFDIMNHRFLEIYEVQKSLEILLEHLGCLYKFHDRPVTYMYNTFHYYEYCLRDRPQLKKKLMAAILGHMKEFLSEPYQAFLSRTADEQWQPDLKYYIQLIRRKVTPNMPKIDWRFNEFPSVEAHMLYITCVELMGLAVGPPQVADGLLDVVAKGFVMIPTGQIHEWINAIGIIMAALPPVYWTVVHDRIIETLSHLDSWRFDMSPFQLFNFEQTHRGFLHNRFSYMLGLAHSVWHHAGPGQIASIPVWVKESLPAAVKTEEQFIFVCHLLGPFLQRVSGSHISKLTNSLYELLAQVDANISEWKYIDPLCDLLYHIKYMFVGDSLKKEIETILRKLKPPLQKRLRFIVHLNLEEVGTSAAS